jgi:recombination protein RecT
MTTTKKASTEELKNKLATQASSQQNKATAQNSAISPYRKLEAYLVKLKPQIEQSLPKTGVTAERLTRLALTTIKQNPKLLEADYGSLLGGVMQAAQAGLEPNFMGSCYLIPYFDKKAGCHLVRFELGYRGMIEIMTRGGRVLKIVANTVHEKDEFFHSYGINEQLHHVPSTEADRGPITHFYAYAPLDNGQVAFKVLSADQINHIRDNYSQAFQNGERSQYGNNSPWVKEYEAMGKKTAIKQLFKDMPIGDREAADLVASDETVRRDITEDPEKIISVEAYEVEQPESEQPQELGQDE